MCSLFPVQLNVEEPPSPTPGVLAEVYIAVWGQTVAVTLEGAQLPWAQFEKHAAPLTDLTVCEGRSDWNAGKGLR